MKKYLFLIAGLTQFFACKSIDDNDLTMYVDPFIGTDYHGHTFPGATVPFGLVQLSPDTRMENWDGSSGYHYSDKTIMGFSHTHLSGTGAPEYCDILLMPTRGDVQWLPGNEDDPSTGYRSAFSHGNETASPGYYSVLLDDHGIRAELTATTRAGFHRYTFPASENANIIIDLKNRDRVIDAGINVVSDTEISGYRRSVRWAKDQHVYFYAVFSKPFATYGIAVDDELQDNLTHTTGTNIKAFVRFKTKDNEQVLVKVGISAVSIENAKMNLDAEITGWDFDGIRKKAENQWNDYLKKIEAEGGTEKERRIFYTALYHTGMHPNIFTDVGGSYRGVDLKVHKADGFTRYTVFSLWDVFRAQMPLFTIIERDRMNDFIKSFLAAYRHRGRLPHWEIWGNPSGSMIGHHSLPVILEAYAKGIRDYDVNLAYEAMKNQVDHTGYYARMGFVPADKGGGSVAVTAEFAYNDWCLAEMAKLLGYEQDYIIYQTRAQNYRYLFDEEIGFMRPRNSDRSWVKPFNPGDASEHFVEGNAYHYSLFAPQDITGLIDLIGGDEAFVAWLDALFTTKSDINEKIVDASGLIGQYAHGNEPSHHMAYLYGYAGTAPKTQAMVRRILATKYNDTPDGLEGNEDCGQMSAWYVLSALGFYPVTPGMPVYAIGSPVFDKVTVHLENGNDFIVEARNNSGKNVYIRSATLNGKPYEKSWFSHDVIMNGGRFVFEMSDEPNYDWGTSVDDRPSTPPLQPAVSMPYAFTPELNFLNSISVVLGCDTEGATICYTTDGSSPDENSAIYAKPITLTQTTTLKFRAFKEGLLPSLTAMEKVIKLEYEKFHDYSGLPLVPGLRYGYYEANVMAVAELDPLTPVEEGAVSSFSIDKRRKDEYFGFIYEGYIRIPADGAYTFYNKTNDGSILYLDDREFINLDGGHPAVERFRTVALRKGVYKISQKYFQMGGGFMNKVSWKGPGFEKEEIPPSVLFHRVD